MADLSDDNEVNLIKKEVDMDSDTINVNAVEVKVPHSQPQSEMKSEEGSLSRVLAEYEKTMSGFIQQIDILKEKLQIADDEKLKIIRERDQALEDLRNVESAFSDVHGKYERAKQLLENSRKNEEILKQRDQDLCEKLENRETRISSLKQKLQEKLETMHKSYESRIKEMEAETNKQRVQLRKAELNMETLQNDVEQKTREIHKLNGLCDELIHGK
jgi:chromosome segregation ATPase